MTVILGGGLSGLSAAYYLRRKFPSQEIILLEASNRIGGWIKSTKHDGFIFEQGPRTIRPQGIKGVNTLKLIQDIGLENKIQFIPKNHPAALNRMIYVNGELHTLPSSFWSIFRKRSPFSKPLINYLVGEVNKPHKIVSDESIYSFVERRFGKEIADYAISPLICGICAGNAEQISVRFLMENMFNNEQKYGSVVKGLLYNLKNKSRGNDIVHNSLSQRAKKEKWSVYFFDGGLEVLPNHLKKVNEDNGVQIQSNKSCTSIEIDNKEVTLHLDNGDIIKTDHLISSISAKKLSQLLTVHTELKYLLASIPFVSVCVINLHYKKELLKNEAFGFLIPPKEKLPILGVIFDSCCFPSKGSTNLTVMMGGYWFESHFGIKPHPELLLDVALKQLNKILEIKEKPDLYQINILYNCIPQYVVGHNHTTCKINEYIKLKKLPLTLCGTSYNGVGINDTVYSAKTAVDNL